LLPTTPGRFNSSMDVKVTGSSSSRPPPHLRPGAGYNGSTTGYGLSDHDAKAGWG